MMLYELVCCLILTWKISQTGFEIGHTYVSDTSENLVRIYAWAKLRRKQGHSTTGYHTAMGSHAIAQRTYHPFDSHGETVHNYVSDGSLALEAESVNSQCLLLHQH